MGGAWCGRVMEEEGKGNEWWGELRSRGRERKTTGFFSINFFFKIIVTTFIEKISYKSFFINILLRNQKKIKIFNQTPSKIKN